jgi:hypothetical protein
MSLVLTTMVPFDFRADVERMAELKALPIRASGWRSASSSRRWR